MMELCNGNRIYENSDSLLWVISAYLVAATKKYTNIKNLILAKMSSCKVPVEEGKGPKMNYRKRIKCIEIVEVHQLYTLPKIVRL
jgi:hypothetical protein